ncbi:hypothetical protein Csa_007537, partial [Cucumis sativus]
FFGENILCVGSSKKRPVLKWENNIAWPGKITLTDKAVYFEELRSESAANSLIIVSSEEVDHGEKTDENEKLLQKEPFETDLDALFQLDVELKEELSVVEKNSDCTATVQSSGIPNHLKSILLRASLILDWTFQIATV